MIAIELEGTGAKPPSEIVVAQNKKVDLNK